MPRCGNKLVYLHLDSRDVPTNHRKGMLRSIPSRPTRWPAPAWGCSRRAARADPAEHAEDRQARGRRGPRGTVGAARNSGVSAAPVRLAGFAPGRAQRARRYWGFSKVVDSEWARSSQVLGFGGLHGFTRIFWARIGAITGLRKLQGSLEKLCGVLGSIFSAGREAGRSCRDPNVA